MTSSRRLVAIMFTDIAGYSSLMGQSEQNALTLLSRNRTIHERRIAEYKGALLKEMGDGILASFPSSSDAVACALTIQKDCIKEHINLRIGIHQGEVVFEKKDVYGDGVNVAARVEKLGIPGSILITKATRDQIRNKAEFGTTLLGNYLLKNIDEEITIYAIEQEGIITPKSDQVFATYVRRNQPSEKPKKPFPPLLAAALLFGAMLLFYLIFYFNWNDDASSAINSERLTQNSLAVLPFANMSRSADEDYFVDGMMEEILNRLFQVADLTIISRTSSMKYKNSSLSTREIAQELGVGNLLEGSVRTDEDRVRISIKLIDGNADTTRWLETYDRQLEDIFELQSAIAYEVATKLKSEIGGDMAERMEYATTEDPEVWKLFMRAKYSETNEDDFQTADSLLRRAIEIEPSFAPAYAELGYLWLWRGSYMGDLEPGEILDMVFSNLNRASTLDPDYPVTHVYLAALNLWFKWDFQAAENEWQEFYRLNPSNRSNDPGYVDFLNAAGRFDEAVKVSNRMLRDDASSSESWSTTGLSFYFAGQPEVAIRHYEEALELFPISSIISDAARTFVYTGRYQRVIDILADEINQPKEASPRSLGNAAIAFFHLGLQSQSLELLDVLQAKSDAGAVGSPSFYSAMVLAQMGKLDDAFSFLHKAYETKEVEMFWLNIEPPFEPLRNDSRWEQVLQKVGF